MSFSPDQIYHQLIAAGEDWSDKDAAWFALDDASKSVLSQIMLRFEGNIASQETQALASKEYEDHRLKLKNARRETNLAKVK